MAEATVRPSVIPQKKSRWALIKEMFAEIDRLNAQMKRDHEEIDVTRVQIQSNLAKLTTILNRIAAS